MQSLVMQMVNDYDAFNRLWENFKHKDIRDVVISDIFKSAAWVKKELANLKKHRGHTIESVSCIQLDQIEMDVNLKLDRIKAFMCNN